jgi:RimJ/RimL family protein N-acetyltransferase
MFRFTDSCEGLCNGHFGASIFAKALRHPCLTRYRTLTDTLVRQLLIPSVVMEKMPYQDQLRVEPGSIPFGWHFGLPTIRCHHVTLREVRVSDAPALLAMLSSEEVAEFVSPLPSSVEAFEAFIAEAHYERARGNSFCFGIVPDGYEDAMGLFQVRQLEPGFGSAEWGFAIGSPFWGRGVFSEGAKGVIDFSFGVVGVHRLEARSIPSNARGNAALRKIGALQEGILRRSFQRNGRFFDQILWSILKEDWHQAKPAWGPTFH